MIRIKELLVIGAVMGLSLAGSIKAGTVEYQFYPTKTTPYDQSWNGVNNGDLETLESDALAITDSQTDSKGFWYYQAASGLSSAVDFQARVRFKILDCYVPPSPTNEHVFGLIISTATATHGREIELGMALQGSDTVIGFASTNGSFFGNMYTSASPDFIEVVLTKPWGTGANMTVEVDGVMTSISAPANSSEFKYIGNQNFRRIYFGMLGKSPTGTVHVVGCTAGWDKDDEAPAIAGPVGSCIIIK